MHRSTLSRRVDSLKHIAFMGTTARLEAAYASGAEGGGEALDLLR